MDRSPADFEAVAPTKSQPLALSRWKHREVRDLAWACFAPPLMLIAELNTQGISDAHFSLTPSRLRWLDALDRDPSALLHHLSQYQSHRLGIYFEQLWWFFLTQDEAVDLVAHNVPIRDGGRTLGEFDCLYYCHERARHVHLELAVKFFLAHPDLSQAPTAQSRAASRWLGPDAKDRLDLKLDHLLNQQIQLSDTPAGRSHLASLAIDNPQREIAVRGYLFANDTDTPTPTGFNPLRSLERWQTLSQYRQTLTADTGDSFVVLHKKEWLGPSQRTPDDDRLDAEQLLDHLTQHFAEVRYPVLVARLDATPMVSANGETVLLENQRCFITRDDWPGV